MSTEKENTEFLKAFTADFWNTANIDAFDQYFDKGIVVHTGSEDLNYDAYKALCQAYFAAFPDLKIYEDGWVAEGDKVTKVWTARSTHQGDFIGIPASGNPMLVKGIEVFRLADGKIVEIWTVMDTLSMMQQMGAIPAMSPA